MNERSIFIAALEKDDPAERAAYLDRACAGDALLRRRVERLLLVHLRADSFLAGPAADLAMTRDDPALAERPGSTVGSYKLLQQIGEGGMGVVYMAEQTEPVRRKVALKIIKPGMDSAQVIARFEAERQALAVMDHPNIARVFDAGTTASGRPYFVMELVHGVPLTQFCDDRQLTPRQRLELFVPVCQAIQHAHQKGIIHRDVKPSNVLVTLYDDKPVPKVIDFGVAKAVEQRLTERTLFTQFGALVGTFEYMSPEQAEMNALGVDTRSDVYSLGVLLYELLTGTTPLEKGRLRQAALDELVRLIKEEEAPRPSVRLSTSHNLPKIAAARKTEPAKLSQVVRGEIDWIAMKCLEKDRTRRYGSADGLARDVQRYLADEPVEACPPTVRYRLGKFARKHQKALATAAAFAAVLVAGTVASTLLAVWAASAEREARAAQAEADRQRDEARRTAYAAGMGLARRAWEENNVARARELLAELPREAAGEDLLGFEWYYLSRLCQAEIRTLTGHAGPVLGVAFSPDGRHAASAGEDQTVKIWDTTTGQVRWSRKGHAGPVLGVAFSPDGRRLASAGEDKTIKVWDTAGGEELFVLHGHADAVTGVAFSPDGRRLASASRDLTAKVWDVATRKELLTFEGHADAVTGVVFSPDGRRLASASRDLTVQVWDGATGKELFFLTGHTEAVLCVTFSPDGRRLASGGEDNMVRVWRVQDGAPGAELFALGEPTNWVTGVAFSHDGQYLAAASFDWTVHVWDDVTHEELLRLKGHDEGVSGVAFSPDGQRLVSGGQDRAVKIWDSAPGQVLFPLQGHAAEVTGVAFGPDGRQLASGSIDKTVKVWDAASGKEVLSLQGHTDRVTGVAFRPDGRQLASGSADKTVKVWDAATGKAIHSLEGHAEAVTGVALSPDGRRLASASADRTVKIWDAQTGKEQLALPGHADRVNAVAFSPDGRRLASAGADRTVKIWDTATGRELLSLPGHTGAVLSVAFRPDGRQLASGSADKTVKVWDAATGRELFALKGHNSAVTGVAFSPDGRRLATGSWAVKIWNGETGKELFVLEGRYDAVTGVAFGPDGRRLAASGTEGRAVYLWETAVAPEVQDRRAAARLVADRFHLIGLRADVVEWLRTVPGLSPSRRQEALAAAENYPEDTAELNRLARELLKQSDRPATDYRRALRYGEAACRLRPQNGFYLMTLGMAHYRVGNYEKALEALLRADPLTQKPFKGPVPANLAFLAMARQRLGQAEEARESLRRLRECLREPRHARDADAHRFLSEAEAVLAEPKSPGGK